MSSAPYRTLNFKYIFDASSEAILVLDRNGVLIENNPAAEKLFGLDKGGLQNKLIYDLVSHTDGKKIKLPQSDHTIGKGSDYQKVSISPKDAGLLTAHLVLKHNGEQAEPQIIAFIKPIADDYHLATKTLEGELKDQSFSDQKRLQEELENAKKKVEERSAQLDTTLQDLVAGNMLLEDQINLALFTYTNISKHKLVEEQLHSALKKVTDRTQELDDTVQDLVEAKLLLEDQVQETYLARVEALKNQQMFVAIAENFPRGIVVIVNDKLIYEYIQGEMMSQLGMDSNRLVGKKINELEVIAPERRERFKNNILETLKGRHLTFEEEFGDYIFSVNTMPIQNEDHKINRALAVYHDITEQKTIEKKVLKSLKEEHQLNELKSRFISTASHEFRTPLSAILTSTDLIEAQNGVGKEDIRVRHLDRIKTNVGRLVEILDDFLSISKMEEGKVKPKPQNFDMVDYTRYLLEELTPNLKTGQSFKTDFRRKKISVRLDPKLLDHILRNLLVNAIKYSEEGKTVVFVADAMDGNVLIEIIDQGIGIPEREHKNMFKRFFRAENATNIQGTGLGLNLVKDYVKLMGGTITFTSKVGKGTTFYVEFPLRPK